MGRDDDGEPILLVDGDSRRRRANYSRGNFSVTSSPQQRGHEGSLDQAFASGSLAVEDPVSPAVGLGKGGSRGRRRGQRGGHWSIHARRNFPDKAFGYLKRVRVTPGF